MKLRDSAPVRAAPEQVWPYVADPALIPFWNPKLVEIDRQAEGPVTQGEAFSAGYRLHPKKPRKGSRKPELHEVEVTRCQPPCLVEYTHRMTHRGKPLQTSETYRVEPSGGGSRVYQEIHIGWGAVPWWAAPLIWFISWFGKPVGETTMQALAQLVESEIAHDDR